MPSWGPPEPLETERHGTLGRLKEFSRKNAKALVFGSCVLVVLVVLLVANVLWRKKRVEEGLAQVSRIMAGGVDPRESAAELEKLRDRFLDFPGVRARILYALGETYYAAGKLDKAAEALREFQAAFPEHFLSTNTERLLNRIERDRRFLEEERAGWVFTHRLYGSVVAAEQGGWGPEPAGVAPRIELVTGKDRFRVALDLFEDTYPNATAHLVELCQKKYFDGVTWTKVRDGACLETEVRDSDPVRGTLACTSSRTRVRKGAVLMVPTDRKACRAGVFRIALKDGEAPERAVIVGFVSEGESVLGNLQAGDEIVSARVIRKRDHEYRGRIDPE